MNVKCPVCGEHAKRDPDTMDTFVCSSWYFLRYLNPRNDKQAFSIEKANKMMPVDVYIGGAEHACMHLLYARFITKALRDMKYLNIDEPFMRLVNQGTILGKDGEKMSKSRGNVVSPDDYISVYGSDVFRTYLMFGFNYIEGGAWSDDGIKAIVRFFERIERFINNVIELKGESKANGQREKILKYVIANTIKSVTLDTERFMFNTAIARIMELLNALYKYRDSGESINADLILDATDKLVLCLAPFAPHFAEEMNQRLGKPYSVFDRQWPNFDPADLVEDVVNVAVQINGKVRSRIDVSSDAEQEEVLSLAKQDEKVLAALTGLEIKRCIYIKGRLLNIVAG